MTCVFTTARSLAVNEANLNWLLLFSSSLNMTEVSCCLGEAMREPDAASRCLAKVSLYILKATSITIFSVYYKSK